MEVIWVDVIGWVIAFGAGWLAYRFTHPVRVVHVLQNFDNEIVDEQRLLIGKMAQKIVDQQTEIAALKGEEEHPS